MVPVYSQSDWWFCTLFYQVTQSDVDIIVTWKKLYISRRSEMNFEINPWFCFHFTDWSKYLYILIDHDLGEFNLWSCTVHMSQTFLHRYLINSIKSSSPLEYEDMRVLCSFNYFQKNYLNNCFQSKLIFECVCENI